MSAQGTYRFYSVQRQTILLVNGEPLGQERVKQGSFGSFPFFAAMNKIVQLVHS